MLSSLMIMNLWIIINNTLCILKELVKQRNQRLTMIKKSNIMLQCFESVKINVKTF